MTKRIFNQGNLYLLILALIVTIAVLQNYSPQKSKQRQAELVPNQKKIIFHDTLQLYDSKDALVVRTDFSSDQAWNKLTPKLHKTYQYGFKAYLEVVNEQRFRELKPKDFETSFPKFYAYHFIFLADSITLFHPEHPVICVDLGESPGRFFRVVPSKIWEVENNLSISNADFEDFYTELDQNGILR